MEITLSVKTHYFESALLRGLRLELMPALIIFTIYSNQTAISEVCNGCNLSNMSRGPLRLIEKDILCPFSSAKSWGPVNERPKHRRAGES